MMVLAVTGGIGSGKTHIVNMFASMGVPVYFTDDRAKGLYDTSIELLRALQSILGEDIVQDGRLRKDIMAARLFADKSLLEKVEGVVHPAVIEDFLKWKGEQEKKNIPFVIMESAIFLENPLLRPLADKVLVITAPLDLRIERVQRRSNLSREQIVERIKNQWSDQERMNLADYVIVSDEKRALLPQIIGIYKELEDGNR
ncbi:MAG: dephospho-CoA kinase [Bacteroidales bacterium]|jgi:dephospho-CoA kinase|nr:dephospho-CoA kinase [Bacteroidales bacterium]